jgi:hypothetical protein
MRHFRGAWANEYAGRNIVALAGFYKIFLSSVVERKAASGTVPSQKLRHLIDPRHQLYIFFFEGPAI